MRPINRKAYISGRVSIAFDEIPVLPANTKGAICDTDDLLLFLSVMMAVVEGREDFSAVLKVGNVPDDLLWAQKPETGITIFSSGTTGVPKPFNISCKKLMSRVSSKVNLGEVLASGYDKSRFAGLQGLLTCLKNGATFVDLTDDMTLATEVAIDRFIGTPSWFNFFLAKVGASNVKNRDTIKSITLGGEAADQLIISRLKKSFPNSRIVHIFASSEAGVLFSIKDEQAGISVHEACEFESQGRLSWSISPRQMDDGDLTELLYYRKENPQTPIASRDFFKLVNSRLLFYGRDSDCVSVGGQTVSLSELERVTNQNEGVIASRASSVSSAVMGSVLTIDIMLESGRSTFDKAALVNVIRTELGSQYIPASIKFVDRINLNSNGKVAR
jgi:acyl-coenzyme A synthetase/AMP-(fatty) acid ligase